LLPLQESAWSQVPAKQRALACAEFVAQVARYSTRCFHLDLKLQNTVVASLAAVLEGRPGLKVIDGDIAQKPLQLLLQQWIVDDDGDFVCKPLVRPQYQLF
jgi:hypothetical protein